jgi:phytoene dehydrogenase-like protein
MGEAAGKKGVWAYVEGGMGKISESISSSAIHHGAEIITNAVVEEILIDDKQQVYGVKMNDASIIEATTVFIRNFTVFNLY